MLLDRGQTERRRWSKAMFTSLVLHCLPFLLLLHRAVPMFITPSSVTQGNGPSSYQLVYLGPTAHRESPGSLSSTPVTLPTTTVRSRKVQQTKQARQINLQKGSSPNPLARAGTRYGTLLFGPTTGPEVRPALPSVFPDPPVSRAELPTGVEGDVIVEITIDKAGLIVDMKLLRGFGYGIDEKVMATLQRWRFRPATMDGVPVDSKQDVRFHYPS